MRELTFVEAAREGLTEEMERDDSVFVVGEGIGARGGNFNTTVGLFERFGEARLRDTPIAERGFTTLCTGAAMAGARPVVDFMFLDFLLDAVGDLIHQTSMVQWMSGGRIHMPIVLRGCVGVLGSAGAHHSGAHYPLFAHAPGLIVAVPTNPHDAKGMLKSAIRSDDPVLFLEHRLLLNDRGPVSEEDYLVPFGQARLAREGTDVSLVAIGGMVKHAEAAAETLAGDGVSVELVDPRTLVPLDMDTILESLAKTGRLLVVDEDYRTCGIGAEIAARIMEQGFDDLDAPVRRLNAASVPAPSSPPLEKAVIPGPADIVAAVGDLLAE
jgi:2-oxoisovalerate dehydrogenase E1 component